MNLSEQFEQSNDYSEKIVVVPGEVTIYLVLAEDSRDGLVHGMMIDDLWGFADEAVFASNDEAHALVAEVVALAAEIEAEKQAITDNLELMYSEDSWDDPRFEDYGTDQWGDEDYPF